MKIRYNYFALLLLLLLAGCVTKFSPDISDKKNLLVVEGMVTDQNETYRIKLSISAAIGDKNIKNPLSGATVFVSDDSGVNYYFLETVPGTYSSDSTKFQGVIGKKYKLNVKTFSQVPGNYNYTSYPVELKPVPAIDSVYYEKVITGTNEYNKPVEGCQIYLDSHDNGEDCRYFRWNYSETWEFQLHWDVPNHTCWRTENSYVISLKNTTVLADNRVNRYPLRFVDNSTDRLSSEYSILVSQYSITADEFNYWEKVKNVTQDVGGLYDIIPSSIIGNVFCAEEPSQPVLGFFSVSAKTSKRLFIRENFSGQQNFYSSCIADTIFTPGPIIGLGSYVWILQLHQLNPFFEIITYTKSCADCTTRGTTTKPDFWDNKK